MKERIGELDAMRGVAALAVAIYHYTIRYGELYGHVKMPYGFCFSIGSYGLPLFFVISGFVIYMTLERSKCVKEFAIKRCIRLYPTFICAVFVTYTIVSVLGLPGREVSITHALLNLTMLQGFIPGIQHVDGAYWSLTVEIAFYVLAAIMFKLKLNAKIIQVSYGWLILSALIKVSNILLPSAINSMAIKLLAADYANLFIAGIMFYHLRQNKKAQYHLLIGVCLVYQFIFNDFNSGIAVAVIFGLFYGLIAGKLKILNLSGIKFLGTISYSLYLVHQNIGYVVIRWMESIGLTSEVYIVIPVAISIALATMITFLIEKPSRNLLLSQYSRKIPCSQVVTYAPKG